MLVGKDNCSELAHIYSALKTADLPIFKFTDLVIEHINSKSKVMLKAGC